MPFNFKERIGQIHRKLESARDGSIELDGVLRGVRDVTLQDYLSHTAEFAAGCKDGVFDMAQLYGELGINPNVMTTKQLISLDQDSRWLVPEIFRDAIRKGLRTSPFYPKIIAASETVAQPQVNLPYFDLSDAEPTDLEEAETISKGTVTYGNKTVEIGKQGIGISITDEALQYSSINLLTLFLQDVGVKLGQKLNNTAIDVLINGDQDDLSENAAVIGVTNITTGLYYPDILRVWIRASRLGRAYTAIIAGEAMANQILNLAEFKDKQAGTTQQSLVVNETLPSQSQLFVSAQVASNTAIFLDPSRALVQLTSAPLKVEADRIVNKQINEAYTSITTGFANIFRDARVIVDQTQLITDADFPSYMTPTL